MTPPNGIDLDQYKAQAKDLLKQARSGTPEALTRLRDGHPKGDKGLLSSRRLRLADAQLVIAREQGYRS
jgi:hypothetical protein